jgi:hypothetical protein
MRTKLYLLSIAFILFVTLQVQGQARFSVEPRVGFGTYSMPQMKQLQQEIRRGLAVPAKITEEFPAYFNHGLALYYHLNEQSRISLFFESGSTGGRITYSDYSGSLVYDQLLQYKAFGSLIGREYDAHPFRFLIGLEKSVIISNMEVKGNLSVYDQSDAAQERFQTVGYGIKPLISIAYPYKRFEPRLTAGYLLNANKPFYLKDDPDMVLHVNNQEAGPNWSGLRVNLSVGLLLGK